MPSYLRAYDTLFRENPRAAGQQWFRDAKIGLLVHYGLFSQLGRGERVQFDQKIPVAEYAGLKRTFAPAGFDAAAICDLAVAAGARYVNLMAKAADGFALFRTNETEFNSLNSPARRDLVGEMAAACDERALGFFVSYAYAQDWRHPYFYSLEYSLETGSLQWPDARPHYDVPQPEYLYRKEEEFLRYLQFSDAQLEEILYRHAPVAGVSLAPAVGCYNAPDLFIPALTYETIRAAQAHTLISFEQGINGDEDFIAVDSTPGPHPQGGAMGADAWERNQGKPVEIRASLQPMSFGYDERAEGQHRTTDDVMRLLDDAEKSNANLLLNTALLPDGSLDTGDTETLLEVGRRVA